MHRARLLSMLTLMILVMTLGPATVVADSPPPGAVTPDAAVTDRPPGYRVDGPSPGPVVRRVPARPEGAALDSQLDTLYRSGWTDGWWEFHFPVDWEHVGSHTSDSDLVEDLIVVDGFMEVVSEWDASCHQQTTGRTVNCQTSKTYVLKQYRFYVESHHFYHKEGYQDDYFETGHNV